MAVTNFALLSGKQKIVWSRDLWSAARDQIFVKRFFGTGQGAMIQRITELSKTEKGEKVLMQLAADLVGDGVIGDDEREGNEEAIQNYEIEIQIDQISNQVKNKGKMADQANVISFRETARDRLAYWLSNRIDQLVFLTLSGISYLYQLDGALRGSTAFSNLAFAADVSAPSAKRSLMWSGTDLVPSSTAAITSAFTASYKMIVKAAAYAKTHYIKPLMAGGKEYYVLLVRPETLSQLKLDPDYQRAVVTLAQKDGVNSPWFTGGVVTVDGLVIHEHRLVYNTTGAAAGSKWGAGGTVDGTRALLCGAQALGMADLGTPDWVEKSFDYDSKVGISVDKMLGLLKPKFYSIYDKSVEDFGVLAIDLAI